MLAIDLMAAGKGGDDLARVVNGQLKGRISCLDLIVRKLHGQTEHKEGDVDMAEKDEKWRRARGGQRRAALRTLP